LPALTCPECGRTARQERSLFRTRRRWRWAMLAIVPWMVAYTVVAWPRTRERGWPGAVPTPALIAAVPWLDSRFPGIPPTAGMTRRDRRYGELYERIRLDERSLTPLSDGTMVKRVQQRTLAWRCLYGVVWDAQGPAKRAHHALLRRLARA